MKADVRFASRVFLSELRQGLFRIIEVLRGDRSLAAGELPPEPFRPAGVVVTYLHVFSPAEAEPASVALRAFCRST